MYILSIILYVICIGIYFLGKDLLKKIMGFIWLGISLVFAILNISDILKVIIYILIAVVGFLIFKFVLPVLDFRKGNSKKVQIENIKVQSISDKLSYNYADVRGTKDEFVINVYVKGKRFDFKVINGEIVSYCSDKMREFVNYEVKDNEEQI